MHRQSCAPCTRRPSSMSLVSLLLVGYAGVAQFFPRGRTGTLLEARDVAGCVRRIGDGVCCHFVSDAQ
jgi:hypothetical protein